MIQGFWHVSFTVSNLARSVEWYTTTGVNQGGWAVYLTDPDGITLELVQPPP